MRGGGDMHQPNDIVLKVDKVGRESLSVIITKHEDMSTSRHYYALVRFACQLGTLYLCIVKEKWMARVGDAGFAEKVG